MKGWGEASERVERTCHDSRKSNEVDDLDHKIHI